MVYLTTIEFLKSKRLILNDFYSDDMRKKAKRQYRKSGNKSVTSGRNSYSFIAVSKHLSIHKHGRTSMDPVFPGKRQESNEQEKS